MKKRPLAHVVDTAGATLLRQILPNEWVIREYKPDYGIDYAVEVFDRSANGDLVSLGEHFFVQLKSKSQIKQIRKKVHLRYNVEKRPLSYTQEDEKEISVLPVAIETEELDLARSMGPAVPLLLVISDIESSALYWVCLNDFVDKVLLPEMPSLAVQSSHTVHVPVHNLVDGSIPSLIPLRFFARRAKLYAAFNRFRYQRHEIDYALNHDQFIPADAVPTSELLELAKHFLSISLAYDFWHTTHAWPAIELTYILVSPLMKIIERIQGGEAVEGIFADQIKQVPIRRDPDGDVEFARFLLRAEISSAFNRLGNLGNVFEEISREWFLPTHFGEFSEEMAIRDDP